MTLNNAKKILNDKNVFWTTYFDLFNIYQTEPEGEKKQALNRVMIYLKKGV